MKKLYDKQLILPILAFIVVVFTTFLTHAGVL